MILAQLVPLSRVFQLNGETRVLVSDQVLPRVASIHADQPVEHRLQVAGGIVPVDRPDDGPGVRQVEAGIEVEVPHEVGLVPAALLVTVAGPDAERRRGGDAAVAGPDLLPVPDVPKVLEVDLPFLGEPVGHAEHEGPGLGVDPRAVVLAAVGARDDQDPEGPVLRGQSTVSVVGFHVWWVSKYPRPQAKIALRTGDRARR